MATLAANALTTVADVKESLGIASGNTLKDNLITRKINQVSSLVEKYCDRIFIHQAYTEYRDGSQIDELVLDQRPIDTTQPFTIERRDTSLNESNFETIDSNLIFIDEVSGVLELQFRALGRWDRYKITYTAGYTTIPADLAEAANMLACYFVNNPAGHHIGVALNREGQRETRFGNNNNLLTFKNIIQQLGIDQILDAYANSPVLADR